MENGQQRQSTVDRVREVLRSQILSGELAPGARLREMEIARTFETSQAPVREALRELEARELVVTEAYKGTYVRAITLRDMLEAYQVRAELECLAGEQAAHLLKGRTAAIEALAARAVQRAAPLDLPGYAAVDHALHRAILEAAGNRVLLRSWDALAFESRIEKLLRTCNVDLQQSLREHGAILEALGQGRSKAAGKLLRAHSLRFAAMIEKTH